MNPTNRLPAPNQTTTTPYPNSTMAFCRRPRGLWRKQFPRLPENAPTISTVQLRRLIRQQSRQELRHPAGTQAVVTIAAPGDLALTTPATGS
jgi:hypothetical protein